MAERPASYRRKVRVRNIRRNHVIRNRQSLRVLKASRLRRCMLTRMVVKKVNTRIVHTHRRLRSQPLTQVLARRSQDFSKDYSVVERQQRRVVRIKQMARIVRMDNISTLPVVKNRTRLNRSVRWDHHQIKLCA